MYYEHFSADATAVQLRRRAKARPTEVPLLPSAVQPALPRARARRGATNCDDRPGRNATGCDGRPADQRPREQRPERCATKCASCHSIDAVTGCGAMRRGPGKRQTAKRTRARTPSDPTCFALSTSIFCGDSARLVCPPRAHVQGGDIARIRRWGDLDGSPTSFQQSAVQSVGFASVARRRVSRLSQTGDGDEHDTRQPAEDQSPCRMQHHAQP